ncbi:MAG: pre-peptidase C-terminal domain-containing protein [Deltaproteobacteria bacterium]|nr:pre-peptidase C-terminal domain-containing protein [Deltaproteobacteria bacterium]
MTILRTLSLLAAAAALTACNGGRDPADTGDDPVITDADGDGFNAPDDCNDNSVAVYPGAAEVCDGVDQDCDGEIDEGTDCFDADGDGHMAAVDCDDGDASTYPGAPESCDGADNDCDGTVDEGTECYDDDFDGETEQDGDCNDANANTYSTAPEVCDGLDNDCDGELDEGIDCSGDGDGDGFTVDQGDCDDTNAAVKPTGVEVCDSLDNDCDGKIDEGTECYDDDGDGQTEEDGDCDDTDRATWTGALEICDDTDNNCDGAPDEGIDCSGDGDLDGYTVAQGDCDDTNSTVHPGAREICDTIDQDCDGTADEDTECSDDDGDGFNERDTPQDCDDTNAAIRPGAVEVTDSLDNDCDGLVDENDVATSTCDTTELEPNNSTSVADAIDLSDGIALACGVIGTAGDVDTFSVALTDTWVELTLDIEAEANGSPLDSVLYLYDSDGVEIAQNDDANATENYDSKLVMLLPEAGTYYVQVRDFHGAGSADHVYELYALSEPVCDHEEVEPNGDAGLADAFTAGESVCGVVDSWSDKDWFKFTVSADSFVDFDVEALSMGTGLQSQLTLYGTDGATELHQVEGDSTTDPFFTWYFATAGTYYVVVESDLWLTRDDGPYLLKTSTW